jgi:hypothetical protein
MSVGGETPKRCANSRLLSMPRSIILFLISQYSKELLRSVGGDSILGIVIFSFLLPVVPLCG